MEKNIFMGIFTLFFNWQNMHGDFIIFAKGFVSRKLTASKVRDLDLTSEISSKIFFYLV